MGLPRIFTDSPLTTGTDTELTGNSARHVAKVLRLSAGDQIILFDGQGSDFTATIATVSKSSITLNCGTETPVGTKSPLQTELWQGISKGSRMDTVVQKATELGVTRIRPVFTRYGVVKLDSARALKKVQHWQEIAISACEQCGRADIPAVLPPLSFNEALDQLDQSDQAAAMMLAPSGDTPLAQTLSPNALNIFMVGPEGGFSSEEEAAAKEKGVALIGLGNRILRTETAPITVLSIAQYLYGDLNNS